MWPKPHCKPPTASHVPHSAPSAAAAASSSQHGDDSALAFVFVLRILLNNVQLTHESLAGTEAEAEAEAQAEAEAEIWHKSLPLCKVVVN